MAEDGKGGYGGGRPWWQWVIIYLIIGGVIYAAIYYFILAPKGGYKAPGVGGGPVPTSAPGPFGY